MCCKPCRRRKRWVVRSSSFARARKTCSTMCTGRMRGAAFARVWTTARIARVGGQSLFGAVRKSWLDQTPEGAWDESMVDGIYNQSYRVPNFLVETVDTPLSMPVYFMRSVGSTAAVVFCERFSR